MVDLGVLTDVRSVGMASGVGMVDLGILPDVRTVGLA